MFPPDEQRSTISELRTATANCEPRPATSESSLAPELWQHRPSHGRAPPHPFHARSFRFNDLAQAASHLLYIRQGERSSEGHEYQGCSGANVFVVVDIRRPRMWWWNDGAGRSTEAGRGRSAGGTRRDDPNANSDSDSNTDACTDTRACARTERSDSTPSGRGGLLRRRCSHGLLARESALR